MRSGLLGIVVCACAGCTMASLERHTVSQTESAIYVRYREALDNLALIADNPSTLPSYASIYTGAAAVQDTGQLMTSVAMPYYSVGMAMLNPSVQRQWNQNWVIDPLVDPEKMEAIRAACQWAIGGPENVYKDSMSLLIRPDQAPAGPDRHFGVADALGKLPAGWLGKGRHSDVPAHALFKAHCGNTWVWVMPEGMKGLADFTLIVQRIARSTINLGVLFNLPPQYSPIAFKTADSKSTDRNQTIVQLVVDQSGQLVTDYPYFKVRIDDTRADPNIVSILSSNGLPAVSR